MLAETGVACDIGVLEALAEEDARNPKTVYPGEVVGIAVCCRESCSRTVERIDGDGFRTIGYCALEQILSSANKPSISPAAQ